MSSIAVHEAKQMLRKELKKRIAALSVEERANQSQYVITKVNYRLQVCLQYKIQIKLAFEALSRNDKVAYKYIALFTKANI